MHIFTANRIGRYNKSTCCQNRFSTAAASSHTRLASPGVVDRGLAESVLKPSIGVGTSKKDFFLFDPSLTSGMSAALMQGHCLRRRSGLVARISQEVSQTAPTTSHQTRDVTCGRVGLMLSQCSRQWANIKLAFG